MFGNVGIPWTPSPQDLPKFRAFFRLPPPFSLFLGLLLVEFWWCLKRPNPQMRTFEVLVPGLRKHHQNSTRRHPEKDKKSEIGAGEGKKER